MLPVDKLEQLVRRYDDLAEQLCRPDVLADRAKQLKLNKERSDLEPLVQSFSTYRELAKRISDNQEALSDPELRELAQAELAELDGERAKLEQTIQLLLLPPDPSDQKNTILEIRSAEGGEEAALFAADLFRMYARYAERKRWKDRDPLAQRKRERRLQGVHRARQWQGRVFAASLRRRRASCAARAGDRDSRGAFTRRRRPSRCFRRPTTSKCTSTRRISR